MTTVMGVADKESGMLLSREVTISADEGIRAPHRVGEAALEARPVGGVGDPLAVRVAVGPDRFDTWANTDGRVGLQHYRLARDLGVDLTTVVPTGPKGTVSKDDVLAEIRRRHPRLAPFRLKKSTLLALSWALCRAE